MTERSHEDYKHELEALDANHAQNEAGRDTFIALAHTALFAASVSFVADVAPIAQAIFLPVLIIGWSCNVIGLLALTFSFGAARRAIDARRAALNETEAPSNDFVCEALNTTALWSFPISLLCIFLFVTGNVIQQMADKPSPPPTPLQKGSMPPQRAPSFTIPIPASGVVPAPRAPSPPPPPPPPKK